MVEEDALHQSFDRDEISDHSSELLRISRLVQTYGALIFSLSFGSAILCAVTGAIAISVGIFDSSESIRYSDISSVSLPALLSILSAIFTLYSLIRRDSLVRRGQVLSDVLIEESERTSAKRKSVGDISVKVAIRSFLHLKNLPLLGEKSNGFFYVGLATASLLASIFFIIASNFS